MLARLSLPLTPKPGNERPGHEALMSLHQPLSQGDTDDRARLVRGRKSNTAKRTLTNQLGAGKLVIWTHSYTSVCF